MRDAQRLRRLSRDPEAFHPHFEGFRPSGDVKKFYCYCCGIHEWASYCSCCGGRACWRCLEWEYPCSEQGNAFCVNLHVPMRECPHVEPPRPLGI